MAAIPLTRPMRDAERLEHAPPHPSAPGDLTTVSASDLMTWQFPPTQWVVPGLLPEGLTLLAGKPKMGKSWLVLSLGLAVADGSVALGHIPVEAGDVLYLALEDTPRCLRHRLALLSGDDTRAPERLALATSCERLDQGGVQKIARWLHRHPATRLIIVDTLAKVRPPAGSGSSLYQDDYNAVSALKQLADQAGVAILLVHHLRKQGATDPLDEISGTTGLTGAVDGMLVLRRERGKPHAVLHASGRDLDDQEIALLWEAETCRWTLSQGTEGAVRSRERTEIIELLRRVVPEALAPAAIAEQLGKPSDAIRQLLPKMARDGEIVKESRGRYCASLPATTPHNDHSDHSDHNGHVGLWDPCVHTESGDDAWTSTERARAVPFVPYDGEDELPDIEW